MITLHAAAEFGHKGQYVARITGRDPKFTFTREFISRACGKRNEHAEADIDEPGLFELCDVGKRGKDQSYCLVLADDATGELVKLSCDKEDAMTIARALGDGRAIADVAVLHAPDAAATAAFAAWQAARRTDREAELEAQYQTFKDAGRRAKYWYEVVTPKQAAARRAAASITEAIDAVCATLAGLSPAEVKKVLAAVKDRAVPRPGNSKPGTTPL